MANFHELMARIFWLVRHRAIRRLSVRPGAVRDWRTGRREVPPNLLQWLRMLRRGDRPAAALALLHCAHNRLQHLARVLGAIGLAQLQLQAAEHDDGATGYRLSPSDWNALCWVGIGVAGTRSRTVHSQ